MKKEVNGMSIISPDRSKIARKILKDEARWDGELPIPVSWFGGVDADDLIGNKKDLGAINILHTSGDDRCFWVKDPVSALILFMKGHDLITDEKVLMKRETFKKRKK